MTFELDEQNVEDRGELPTQPASNTFIGMVLWLARNGDSENDRRAKGKRTSTTSRLRYNEAK